MEESLEESVETEEVQEDVVVAEDPIPQPRMIRRIGQQDLEFVVPGDQDNNVNNNNDDDNNLNSTEDENNENIVNNDNDNNNDVRE